MSQLCAAIEKFCALEFSLNTRIRRHSELFWTSNFWQIVIMISWMFAKSFNSQKDHTFGHLQTIITFKLPLVPFPRQQKPPKIHFSRNFSKLSRRVLVKHEVCEGRDPHTWPDQNQKKYKSKIEPDQDRKILEIPDQLGPGPKWSKLGPNWTGTNNCITDSLDRTGPGPAKNWIFGPVSGSLCVGLKYT